MSFLPALCAQVLQTSGTPYNAPGIISVVAVHACPGRCVAGCDAPKSVHGASVVTPTSQEPAAFAAAAASLPEYLQEACMHHKLTSLCLTPFTLLEAQISQQLYVTVIMLKSLHDLARCD